MWIYDLETLSFLAVNDAACYHYGYSRDEFLSMTIKDIRPPEDIPALLENVSMTSAGLDDAGVWRHRKKDGNIIYVKIVSHTLDFNGRRAELVLANDITRIMDASEILRRKEEYFRSLIENVSDIITILNTDGIISYESPSVERVFGYRPDDLVGKNAFEFIHPDDAANVMEAVIQAMQDPGNTRSATFRFRHKDGSWRILESIGKSIPGNNGAFDLIANSRDITERIRAEEELRASAVKLEEEKVKTEAIIAAIGDGISIQDTDFSVLYQNQTHKDFIGNRKGEYCYSAFEGRNHICEGCPVAQSFRDGRIHTAERSVVRGGRISYFEITASPLRDSSGKIIAGIEVARDITRRKLTENRLARLNDCFLGFGTDPLENINRLTVLCGELMGATCALYNRLDKGMLCSWGQWNTPPDYKPVDMPDGHICYDIIKRGGDDVTIIRNLPETSYARTDPNVAAYKLKTYIGKPVKFTDDYVGSLCVVYQDDFSPGDDDIKFMGVIASAIGIEEKRKQAKDELKLSKEFVETVVNSINDAICIIDVHDFRIIDTNQAFLDTYGMKKEDAIGKHCYETSHKRPTPCDSPHDVCPLREVLKTGKSSLVEHVHYVDGGKERYVEVSASPIRNENGEITSVVHVSRDITERKRVMEKLEESEARLAQAQRIAHIGSWEHNLQTNELYNSEEAYRLLDATPGEITTFEGFLRYTHPEDRELVRKSIEEAIKGKRTFNYEYRTISKDGSMRVIHTQGEVAFDDAGKPIKISGTAMDITERKLAEEAIQESERKYRRLFEYSNDIIVQVDRFGKVVAINNKIKETLGFTPGEVIGKYFFNLGVFGIKELPYIVKLFKKAVVEGMIEDNTGKFLNKLELKLKAKNGKTIFIEANTTILRKDGKIEGFLSNLRDITERKQAEEALRESEERYRRLVELSPVAIAVHSEGKIVFANTAAIKLLGAASPGQLIGKKVMDIVHPESRELVKNRIQLMAEQGKVVLPAEEKFIRLNGSVLDVEVAAMPFPYKGKQGMQVIAHDITARKMAEEMQKERARAELYGFIVSALPVFASNVPSSVRDNLVRNFAERFEKNVRPRFEEEMKRPGDTQTRETMNLFMLWLGNFFSNMDIQNRTAIEGPKGHLMLLNCPWKGDASSNPVFCFICRTIAIRSFTWSSLKGNADQKSSIANGAKACIFEIYQSSGKGVIN